MPTSYAVPLAGPSKDWGSIPVDPTGIYPEGHTLEGATGWHFKAFPWILQTCTPKDTHLKALPGEATNFALNSLNFYLVSHSDIFCVLTKKYLKRLAFSHTLNICSSQIQIFPPRVYIWFVIGVKSL